MTHAGWYALWQTPVAVLLVVFGGPWLDVLGLVLGFFAGGNTMIATRITHPDLVKRHER